MLDLAIRGGDVVATEDTGKWSVGVKDGRAQANHSAMRWHALEYHLSDVSRAAMGAAPSAAAKGDDHEGC